jgi:hypothetical protein
MAFSQKKPDGRSRGDGQFCRLRRPGSRRIILRRTGGDWNPLIHLFGAACVVWGIVALRMFEEHSRDSASAAGGTFVFI